MENVTLNDPNVDAPVIVPVEPSARHVPAAAVAAVVATTGIDDDDDTAPMDSQPYEPRGSLRDSQ